MAALSTAPVAPEYVYCTQGDVEAVLSADGVTLRLDDDQGGTADATELAYLTTAIIRWATGRVNMYLLGRYSAVRLSESYVVNDFTATIAAHRLCRRRGNPAPESIADAYKETIELLQEIKGNRLALEDVPERVSSSIAWSNIRHSRHVLRRNRVQRPISEQTRPQHTRNTDLPAEYVGNEIYWL